MGTAISLFGMTIAIAIGVAILTALRADRAQSKNKHFGGVPHRSIYELDTSMSARERLDERSDFGKFRHDRTQEALRQERTATTG